MSFAGYTYEPPFPLDGGDGYPGHAACGHLIRADYWDDATSESIVQHGADMDAPTALPAGAMRVAHYPAWDGASVHHVLHGHVLRSQA